MNAANLPRLLLALAVTLAAARLLGAVARRLGQPPVVGEIIAGVLLGPTLAGGIVTTAIFPSSVRPALGQLASIGVCIFMFFVGLHLDRGLLRGQGRIVTTVSVSSIVLPFGLGVLLALYLVDRYNVSNRLAFVLFIGVSMSITAFPVLARILSDNGLVKTPIGGLALACAALDDMLAWSLLAGVVAISHAGGDPWRVLVAVPFAAMLLTIIRPQLARLAQRRRQAGALSGAVVLAAGAAGLTLCAAVTDWMGLHPIFGAFLFGFVMPGAGVPYLRVSVLPWVERINALVLLPVFFVVVGIRVDLSHVGAGGLVVLALILATAVGGKGIGAFAGAWVCGVRPRNAAVLATLINTRGLTELIALAVGRQMGLIDQGLFSLMIVMAIVTTLMTGVLLRLLYPMSASARPSPCARGQACCP